MADIVRKFSQTSFSSGEIGQYLDGRADNAIYAESAQTVENMLVLPHGGLQYRRGFEYVDTLGDTRDRLVNFNFNNEQQYVLVFGGSNLKVYKDKVLQATVTTGYPYSITDVEQIKWAQSGDTMILVHPTAGIHTLERVSDTTWTFAVFSFDFEPMFRFSDTDGIDITPSAINGAGITLTATSALFTDDWDQKFLVINGGYVQINDGTLTGTASTTATADVVQTLDNTNQSSTWDEQIFSAHRGFPRAVAFHQQRLYFAGSTQAPQTIVASKTADFFDFDQRDPTLDDEGFAYTLATDQVHTVRDLKSTDTLLVWTAQAEFEMSGNGNPITPSNVLITPQTEYGISNIRVQFVDGEFVFVTNNEKEVRAYGFDLQTDAFIGKNYTIAAHHILNRPKDMAYLRSYADTQANYVFLVNSDGEMPVLSVTTERQVLGWSRFTTNGNFHHVAVTATDDVNGNPIDTLYATVERDNGVFLEALTEQEVFLDAWEAGELTDTEVTGVAINAAGSGYSVNDTLTVSGGTSTTAAQLNVDSVDGGGAVTGVSITTAGQYSVEPTNPVSVTGGGGTGATFDLTFSTITQTNWSGADHLDNVTCGVVTGAIGSPFVNSDVTVSGTGTFTTDNAVSNVQIGYRYTGTVKTLPITIAADNTLVRGDRIRKVRAQVNVFDSRHIKVDSKAIVFRSFGDDFNSPIPAKSGTFEKKLLGYSTDPTITITFEEPLKATLLTLSTELAFSPVR